MDIIARLNEFVSQRKLSPSQFADILGIPRPSASQILSGRNKKISNEFLGKIHNAFPDLDLMWLMFGEATKTPSSSATFCDNNAALSGGSNISGSNAPSLFDTQDGLTYNQADNSQTESEHVCESVIDDLKKTAPFLREIKPSGQSRLNTTSILHSSIHSKESAVSVSEENASTIQPKKPIDTTSTAPTVINASQRIESIIVYYKDKTFQVFKPE